MTLTKRRVSAGPARHVVGAAPRRDLPRLSLRDRAYEVIKERIITCQFRPGECINEASVSALIGLGRTPVHQAIDRLMLEEMVDVIPRKGVIVKPVILQDVMQMIEVRMVNETQCARLAAARAEESHIEQMSAVLRKATRAIDKQDVHSLMELDREFHLLLANASKNFELAEIIRRLNERSLRFWFISFTTPDHHRSFQRQHEALFDGVRRHDADAAEDAMRVHIEAFRKSVARHL
ncbi:MAG TPA: GntR family transcriptional regulator [Blastocatellia bacterium]|jgi:DNA-binding GntR family transcriptional regulator|nr:GntR family transcriptional regulator [Blastocatellia bacterium]